MKKLLEYLAASLVQHPKDLKIEENKQENQVFFSIKANPEDLKILIGKGGQTIKAIRELMHLKSFNQKEKGFSLPLGRVEVSVSDEYNSNKDAF